MSQNHDMLPGTNIPADPRKRSHNHARLTLTLWMDIPDEVLAGLGHTSTVDALRDFYAKNVSIDDINSLRSDLNKFMGYSKDDEHPGVSTIMIEVAP